MLPRIDTSEYWSIYWSTVFYRILRDVPRLNESKVVLKDRKDDQSYIHANYCSTPKGEKRFICTQVYGRNKYCNIQ